MFHSVPGTSKHIIVLFTLFWKLLRISRYLCESMLFFALPSIPITDLDIFFAFIQNVNWGLAHIQSSRLCRQVSTKGGEVGKAGGLIFRRNCRSTVEGMRKGKQCLFLIAFLRIHIPGLLNMTPNTWRCEGVQGAKWGPERGSGIWQASASGGLFYAVVLNILKHLDANALVNVTSLIFMERTCCQMLSSHYLPG